MSNGEQTYKALKASVLKTLIASFDPDWVDLVEDAYKGFIKDAQDDTKVEVEIPNRENPDSEMVIQAYISDDGECSDISKPLLLSDVLLEAVRTYGKEDALRALNNSLAKVYTKLENKQ